MYKTIKDYNLKGKKVIIRCDFNVPLDKDFNIIGTFEERPNIIKAVENFDDIKLDYYKGKYLLDTASDFINIINNNK